jgi:hypothetical protein
LAAFFVTAAVLVPATPAGASQLIDRNTKDVQLLVATNGVAQLTYLNGAGATKQVMAWGALNAAAPTNANAKQQEFTVNFANGHGTPYEGLGKRFPNACQKYTGPALMWVVAACTAPDGSHWVAQSWQRNLNDWGQKSTGIRLQWELRLSHFSGELPVLDVRQDWAYAGRFEHFFGKFTYRGLPLHGFKTDSRGAPLDKFGVLIYMDTFGSKYGPAWQRETGWVTHMETGAWCYTMNPHGSRPVGNGTDYRMTVQSPGALPDIFWKGKPIGKYDPAKDAAANELQKTTYASKSCTIN